MVEAEATNLERLLSRMDAATPAAIPAACAKVRHRGSSCRICLDVCPAGAITVGETLAVDPDRCLSCGLCARVCPTGAFAFNRSHSQFLNEATALALASGEVTFACPRYRGDRVKADSVRVLCLGALDEAILLGSVVRGAGAVHLVDAPCTDCPLACGREAAAATAETCNALLQAFGRPERVSFVNEPPISPTGHRRLTSGSSRRQFLGLASREAVTTLASALLPGGPPDGPKEWLKRQAPPTKHVLLLDALRRLAQSRPRQLPADVASPLASLIIDDGCTGCGMCSTFCPTGALTSVSRDDETVQITVQWENCTGCNLCADICYRGAIAVDRRQGIDRGEVYPEILWQGRPADSDGLVRKWAEEQLLAG